MEKTPKTQATTTMKNITFDGMPVALASLHEKCDTIIALLSNRQRLVRRSHAHARWHDRSQ